MRTVREIYDVLFAFAPERMKMGDWDNVGLLCGRFTTEVETVLVALDPLPDVIAEAVELGAQCIVTHHPLFFDPPRAINETTLAGRSVLVIFGAGHIFCNVITERFSFVNYHITVLDIMEEDVCVFLFLLRERCKRLVKLIQHSGSFRTILQCLDVLFEPGVHIVGINYTGIDFRQVGVDFIRHIFNTGPSATASEQFLIA